MAEPALTAPTKKRQKAIKYLEERRKLINTEKATTDIKEGDPWKYEDKETQSQVTEKEEIQRISYALATIRNRYPKFPISIDTFRGEVAKVAVKEFNVGELFVCNTHYSNFSIFGKH